MGNLQQDSVEQRIDRLHAGGIVDLHFDLPMELYEKRGRPGVLGEFIPQLRSGGVGVIGAAIYLEDRYLPEMGLRVALDQVARLVEEVELLPEFAICRSYHQIAAARSAGKIALLITMEGVEPLGSDLNLLRIFYELGIRAIGLTHARRNAAGDGGVFAPTGSAPGGLTAFGRDVVRECERLGIMVDLAHISPDGFDDILEITTKPPLVSHTNARKYYDIERNVSDEQIKRVAERGGVIGVNSILVSPDRETATLDRYVDHIEHIVGLSSIDNVGIGFDFFEFIYRQWPIAEREEFHRRFSNFHFIPELLNHGQARALTRKLIERGFGDEQIEKILFGNWLRLIQRLL